jgi:hypothetical protein
VTSIAGSPTVGLVLELDPDLGGGIDPPEREAARQACRGELLRVARGAWPSASGAGERDDLVGFVIVDGLVARKVGFRDCCMLELLGHMDVLQPPVATGLPRMASASRLTALSDVVLLLLGRAFVRAAARWPSLLARLQRRLEVQRESLAIQGLIGHLPNAEHRLLLMLWHLADRWGYVTRDGTVLPLALNHALLGQLIGARRPTVSLAVGELEKRKAVRRRDDGSWLLTTSAKRMVASIARSAAATPSVGERLMLHRLVSQNIADARALRAEASQILGPLSDGSRGRG